MNDTQGTTLRRRRIAAFLGAAITAVLCAGIAEAQFGFGLPGQRNLPQDDFTWTWGNPRGNKRGLDDISILGSDSGFRCNLTAKLSPGSRLSRMDVRGLENQLRSNMNFATAAANAMNDLESRGELDWATLACTKPKRKR